jgi:hypothetical protein
MDDDSGARKQGIKYIGNITSHRRIKFHQSCSEARQPPLRFVIRRRYATSIKDPWEALAMKLLTLAVLSAVLVVPCFANAKVSASSPNLPYPRNGIALSASPNLPYPRDLGRGIIFKGSPNLPYPRNGIAMSASPNLPYPRDLGRGIV